MNCITAQQGSHMALCRAPFEDLGPIKVSRYIAYVSLRLCMQNAVSAQPCVGKLGISLVLLNFLDCNFRLWLETP